MEQMLEKSLVVYKLDDEGSSVAFPNSDNPIEVLSFKYEAQRMGAAPSITATIMHSLCLDDLWDNSVYVSFNGEKYYIRNTPTSSYSNEDNRYKYEVEFVSERRILDNVYFYDVVTEDGIDYKPVSNSSNVVFYGDIKEFANRLRCSLKYANIDYEVVVDEDIESEDKLMSFNDQFFSNVLQEVYNTYEIPYYFVGKTIHIGFKDHEITEVFKYGIDDALLSITKTNANYKTVNRCTGVGSTDNLHYYYPMSSEGIEILFDVTNGDKSRVERLIASKIASYANDTSNLTLIVKYESLVGYNSIDLNSFLLNGVEYSQNEEIAIDSNEIELVYKLASTYDKNIFIVPNYQGSFEYDYTALKVLYRVASDTTSTYKEGIYTSEVGNEYSDIGGYFLQDIELGVEYEIKILLTVQLTTPTDGIYSFVDSDTQFYGYEDLSGFVVEWSNSNSGESGKVSYDKSGVVISNLTQADSGFTITTKDTVSIPHSQYLMPSVYRNSNGNERFYNAKNYPFAYTNDYDIDSASGEYLDEGFIHNDKYKNPNTGEYYVFSNIYNGNNPLEHKETFEDIKPTIKNIVNSEGKLFGVIADIAYDSDDNDEVDDEGNYEHPYFYIKLNKFDGEFGFNLFDYALEDGEMSLSMISGNCGACEFPIQVVESVIDGKQIFQNPVQITDSGNIVEGSLADKINTNNIQPKQQNTQENEVWVAVKKDINTFGVVMPNVLNNYKPQIGDEFVILHIGLPKEYIYAAERQLDEHIIAYMAENNSEKFTFDIKFSRIYFQENKDILYTLSENSLINIQYNNRVYPLYVSSYSYSIKDEDALPEINISLSEVITISQNAIDNAISGVKMEFIKEINSINITSEGQGRFLRKDIDDKADNTLTFKNVVIKDKLTLDGGILENVTLGSLSNVEQKVDDAQKDCVLVTTEDKQWSVKNISDVIEQSIPDVSDFVTKEDVNEMVADFVTEDEVSTILSDYVKHRTSIDDDYIEIDIEQYF